MSDAMVVVEGVSRTYRSGGAGRRSAGEIPREVRALADVSFSVPEGRLVAVRGRSGSGKTTLLNITGGLDSPTSGRVTVGEHEITALGEAELLRLRRETIGFVFQSFGLIPVLSAAENIGVALRLTRTAPRERDERVALLLGLVGLAGQGAPQLMGGRGFAGKMFVAIATSIFPEVAPPVRTGGIAEDPLHHGVEHLPQTPGISGVRPPEAT